MRRVFHNFLQARRSKKEFEALPRSDRRIVFYSEDAHSMVHFRAIIDKLINEYGKGLCYLTSDINDPILKDHHPNMRTYYIGDGAVRTIMFVQMEAGLVIMTMPDLETLHIKRSKAFPVHYLYIFHAMVSTHSNYRKAAFDHFDTIHCTGPHQIEEIRATEKAYELPEKRLVEVGYRYLEALMRDASEYRKLHGEPSPTGRKTVIVAPSWGENAILETCGEELVRILLEAGYVTIVRPHPMTTKHNSRLVATIAERFGGNDNFKLQTDVRDKISLYESHVMISDWSGVAMEYAFACERPVVFIDVPKKCNNPETDRIPQVPVEVSLRGKVGRVISPNQLDAVVAAIESICADTDQFTAHIREVRDSYVFNLGRSVDVAARDIVEIADELQIANDG